MATEIIHTLKASGGDYTSFIAWEAAQQRNLVTADEVAILEFYQGDYTSSGGGDNFVDYTSSFTIDGWTTDATRKIIVRPAAGEEHAGTKDTGLRIHFTGDWNTLGVGEGYTYITGVIVNKKNYQGPGIKQVYATSDSASETVFENCISYNASPHYGYEYSTNTSSTPCIYINCLAHDCGIGFIVGDYKYSRILNCSAIGNVTGFNVGKNNSQFAELKNCLGSDNSNLDFSINPSPSSSFDVDYCASEDATADDRGAASNRINQTFTFVDAVGLDFHLASADAGAIGYGVDLSSHSENPFSTDIDLESRGTTWDIGFDQYVAAAGTSHNLEGAASGVAAASGALSLAVPLAGASIAASTASGAVSVAIPLDGVAQAVATGGGTLALDITLQGSALAAALASAALSLGVSLAGSALGEAAGSGDLTTSGTVDLAGAATADATGLGTITLNISLAGAAIAEASASGDLTIDGAVDLAGNAIAEAVGGGALSVAIPLDGFAASVASAGGVLALVVPLEGVAVAASTATGGLDVAVTLSASALATAAATGDLSLSINLSGAAVALATGAGLLASDGDLTGTPGWEIIRTARDWEIARTAREWRIAA